MNWLENFNNLKSKNDLLDHELSVIGREPEPMGKGLFTATLKDWTANGALIDVTITRRDIQAIKEAYPEHFTLTVRTMGKH